MRKRYDEVDEEYEGFQEDTTSMKVMLLSQIVIIAVIFLIAAGLYIWKSADYKEVFLPGTVINQISCGNMTVKQVEEHLAEQVERYDLTIVFKKEEKAVISGEDIHYEYVSSGEVQKLLNRQNPFRWIVGYFREQEYSVGADITFDLSLLKQEISKIIYEKSLLEELPQGAYIQYVDGKFEIMDAVEGNALNETVFQNEVIAAVRKSQTTLKLEAVGAYMEPELTNNSELLQQQIAQLNELASASITYLLPTEEVVLDGSTILSWLSRDENGNYYKDEKIFKKQAEEYVKELAARVDNVGKDRTFLTTSGLTADVPSGSYGWKIDQKKEVSLLLENIRTQAQISREPEYSSREKYMLNNGFGFTYVEVNLSEQHLYYYKDGKVVFDSKLVSGKMTKDWYTPDGIYFLQTKERSHTVNGAMYVNGVFTNAQTVQYWMGLNDTIGIHDASWCQAFGGDYYQTAGSYGTIYLPPAQAEKLYSMLERDTLIVCVYNEAYQLRDSEPMPTPTPEPTPTTEPTVEPIPTA